MSPSAERVIWHGASLLLTRTVLHPKVLGLRRLRLLASSQGIPTLFHSVSRESTTTLTTHHTHSPKAFERGASARGLHRSQRSEARSSMASSGPAGSHGAPRAAVSLADVWRSGGPGRPCPPPLTFQLSWSCHCMISGSLVFMIPAFCASLSRAFFPNQLLFPRRSRCMLRLVEYAILCVLENIQY